MRFEICTLQRNT